MRIRCSHLIEVAKARNGQNLNKDNRYLVWLNCRMEQYELCELKDGERVNFADVEQPTQSEESAAVHAIDEKRKKHDCSAQVNSAPKLSNASLNQV